jgi:hypothetical protein
LATKVRLTFIIKEYLKMPNYADLLESLNELTTALVQHTQFLELHNATMESLTRALKELDTTINQETKPETKQPSQQLKQALNSFVETYINPRFYHPHKLLNAD